MPLSIGQLYLYFVVDIEYDNSSRRENVSKEVIKMANRYFKEHTDANMKYALLKQKFGNYFLGRDGPEYSQQLFLNSYDADFEYGDNTTRNKGSGRLIVPEKKDKTDFKFMRS